MGALLLVTAAAPRSPFRQDLVEGCISGDIPWGSLPALAKQKKVPVDSLPRQGGIRRGPSFLAPARRYPAPLTRPPRPPRRRGSLAAARVPSVPRVLATATLIAERLGLRLPLANGQALAARFASEMGLPGGVGDAAARALLLHSPRGAPPRPAFASLPCKPPPPHRRRLLYPRPHHPTRAPRTPRPLPGRDQLGAGRDCAPRTRHGRRRLRPQGPLPRDRLRGTRGCAAHPCSARGRGGKRRRGVCSSFFLPLSPRPSRAQVAGRAARGCLRS